MTRIIALSLALLASTTLSALATSDGVSGKPDAAVSNQIKTQLVAEGYEVRKIKTEDGMYEAYALKDGAKFEIYFDSDLNIVKTKTDD